MAIQPAICVNCGGSIKVDDVDLNGFCECEFCHTAHKVIDIITIDGLPTVKSLLTNADMLLDDGNAEKAATIYREAIKIKPNCHEAWWGLYICNSYFDRYYQYKDKYGNSGPFTKASIMAETLRKYAFRAIEYAPPATKAQYESKIKPEMDFIDSVQRGDYDQKTKTGTSGCYIATAVYGSYTCPEVFALRKYRDEYLSRYFWGRWFIKCYYFISPHLARHILPQSKTGKYIRKILDKKAQEVIYATKRR